MPRQNRTVKVRAQYSGELRDKEAAKHRQRRALAQSKRRSNRKVDRDV